MTTTTVKGQSILDRRISIDVTGQRLARVLELLSNKGNFYFSYNSNIIQRDSIVNITVTDRSIRQVLDQLLKNRYTYIENNNYIILRRAVIQSSIVSNTVPSEEKLYTITGFVMNAMTGEKMPDVSVYEKERLISTLTDQQGYFEIKLKSRYKRASLTASKASFSDTSITVTPRFNQQIIIAIIPEETTVATVTISPVDFERPDSITIPAKDSITIPSLLIPKEEVERTAAGKFLLSAKQKIQSINLKRFFAERPFQVSLLPGISTQGKLSAQVSNKLSFNILGGYTGGVKAFELGGLFNINKKDVRLAQVGGLFNVTGGTVTGVQIGGVNNTVLDNVTGVQIAGVNNYVQGKFIGWQIGGVYNHTTDSVRGLQLAGVSNFSRRYIFGAQISGVLNVAKKDVEGLQLSGVFNYTKRLKGVQIGLINIADTSDGYSIGLINIIFKGYHKFDFYNSEALDLNAAFKTGSQKLYSILLLGSTPRKDNKIYSFGYGMGHEITLSKRFTLNPEITSQYIYMGSWDYFNLLTRLTAHLHIRFGKYFSLFAGPSLSIYQSEQQQVFPGYASSLLPESYHTFKISSGDSKAKGWFGWNVGFSLF
ncbi:MAG: STN and carboxypeptidase regulatory-like domain-containing protein [Chitinophagaceae bacterium]